MTLVFESKLRRFNEIWITFWELNSKKKKKKKYSMENIILQWLVLKSKSIWIRIFCCTETIGCEKNKRCNAYSDSEYLKFIKKKKKKKKKMWLSIKTFLSKKVWCRRQKATKKVKAKKNWFLKQKYIWNFYIFLKMDKLTSKTPNKIISTLLF